MQLKTVSGLTIFVLLFGIAAIPLMNHADAAYGSSTAYATNKDTKKDKDKTVAKDTKKDKDKTVAKDTKKDKDKTVAKDTKLTEVKVTIAKGAASPGCDTKKECYKPFEVKVKKGTKVTWTNPDTAAHTVTSGKPGVGDGTFDSSMFGPGKTFSYTFSKAGSYDYFCTLHMWMTGKVTVS